MQDFNYWLIAVQDDADQPPDGQVSVFSSYSAAMSLARMVKHQNPTWRVAVEVLPAGAEHPDIGPDPMTIGGFCR